MRGRLAVGLLLLFSPSVEGCNVDIPEGVFTCSDDGQCPDGWSCRPEGLCSETPWTAGSGGFCVPNESDPCDCSDGGKGVRVCDTEGRWGECTLCGPEVAGSGGGSGGQSGGASENPRRIDCWNHQLPFALTSDCKICLCGLCPKKTLECDNDCWSLVGCGLRDCPERDPGCIAWKCTVKDNLDQATGVLSCIDECKLDCMKETVLL